MTLTIWVGEVEMVERWRRSRDSWKPKMHSISMPKVRGKDELYMLSMWKG